MLNQRDFINEILNLIIIKDVIINKMMVARPKCCQCMFLFTMTKLPRKLPCCEHSICQTCIREIIDSKQDIIICGFCSATVKKEDIRIFPLNTSILLSITEMPIMEQPANQEENGLLLADIVPAGTMGNEKGNEEMCELHKVTLDIVCISDRQRICPHCALFGNHRDHRFKRLQDFEKEVEEKRKIFQQIKNDKKRAYQNEIMCMRELLRGKIELKKAQLCRQVDQQFKRYEQQLRVRRESAFHEIDQFLVGFEEHLRGSGGVVKFQKTKGKLQQWQSQCESRLFELDRAKRVEERLQWYYDGPLEIVSEGYIFIEELEKLKHQALRRAGESLQQVRVVFEEKGRWFESCVRVGKGGFSPRTSGISLPEVGECQVNPFLDCTSSQIILGHNSFFNTNTSLEVDIASIPSSSRLIDHVSQRTPVRKEQETKHLRSVDKERPRLQTNVSATQIKKPAQIYSPKISTVPVKRPISELSAFRSPSKVVKSNLPREMPEQDIKNTECKQPQKIYLQFSKNTLSDYFDISDCNLSCEKVVQYVHRARRIHRIRGLKLCNNGLTTAGFERMVEFLQGVSNINVAGNRINEGIFQVILKCRDKLESLKVINLVNNPINLDKKAASRMEEVKKMNIVVTL